jgi:hypothetical protein
MQKPLTVSSAKKLLAKGLPVIVEDEHGVQGLLRNAVGHVTAIVDWPNYKGYELSISRIRVVK